MIINKTIVGKIKVETVQILNNDEPIEKVDYF